jgi:hypothetical protein
MSKRTRAAALGAAALAAGLGAYPVFFRRWCLTWGARPDEVSGTLPGDELLPRAGIVATRAITIGAPPAAIWPWLVQMGSGRGGVYTYDWIENLLGLDMHSTRRILPQYQGVKVGDEFPLGPGRPAMRVAVLDPGRTFTLRFADGNWVWIFALSAGDGHTRLISRNRIAAAGAWRPACSACWSWSLAALIMERKMLLGIKERAEEPGPRAGRRCRAMTSTVKRSVPPPTPGQDGQPAGAYAPWLAAARGAWRFLPGAAPDRPQDRPPVQHPVGYVDMEGRLAVVTVARWRVNLRGGADVEVTRHGHLRPMHALLDEDPASVAVSYQAMIDRIGLTKAQRQLGISLPGGRAPTALELKDAAREYGWSVITLTPR